MSLIGLVVQDDLSHTSIFFKYGANNGQVVLGLVQPKHLYVGHQHQCSLDSVVPIWGRIFQLYFSLHVMLKLSLDLLQIMNTTESQNCFSCQAELCLILIKKTIIVIIIIIILDKFVVNLVFDLYGEFHLWGVCTGAIMEFSFHTFNSWRSFFMKDDGKVRRKDRPKMTLMEVVRIDLKNKNAISLMFCPKKDQNEKTDFANLNIVGTRLE